MILNAMPYIHVARYHYRVWFMAFSSKVFLFVTIKTVISSSQNAFIHSFASLTLAFYIFGYVRKLLKTKIETNCVEHCVSHNLSFGVSFKHFRVSFHTFMHLIGPNGIHIHKMKDVCLEKFYIFLLKSFYTEEEKWKYIFKLSG